MSSQTSTPLKLLSLDGGGVRGISSMVILLAIMDKHDRVGDDKERLPCRYFDLAGGTSTGGLAAIMLFRLEMSTSDVIDQYESMASKIFSKKDEGPFFEHAGYVSGNGLWWVNRNVLERFLSPEWRKIIYEVLYNISIFLGCSYYSGTGLVEAVDEVAARGESLLLLDDSKPKAMLLTTIHEPGSEIASKGIMRSYTPPDKDNDATGDPSKPGFWKDIKLRDAARATTSAPFYFPAAPFKKHLCVDGGLLNNNPVERVWDARYELGSGSGKAPHVSLVVSLGTAKGPRGAIEAPGDLLSMLWGFFTRPGSAIQRLLAIIDLATNTEEPHLDFNQRIKYRNLHREEQNEYLRFNAKVDKSIDLDDVQGMKGLKGATEKWLLQTDVSLDINKCARSLAKKAET